MSHEPPPMLMPTDERGRPLAAFGPEHILSTRYVRDQVRFALEISDDDRPKFWAQRRRWMARRLHECGLDEDEVAAAMRAFGERARREAVVRRLLIRIEAEAVAEGGDP